MCVSLALHALLAFCQTKDVQDERGGEKKKRIWFQLVKNKAESVIQGILSLHE